MEIHAGDLLERRRRQGDVVAEAARLRVEGEPSRCTEGDCPLAITSKLEALALVAGEATGLTSTDGGLRWRVACSNEYAIATSVASAKGRPSSSMPTGNPPGVNPAGTFIAGNPV